MSNRTLCLTAILFSLLQGAPAAAQELTPRAYWPLPVGTNVFIAAFQRNSGDIVTDPSLPITGVESEIDFFQVGYQRSLNWLGRTSSLQVSVPYSDGLTDGVVDGVFLERRTTGLADVRVRFAVDLKGAPAMDAAGLRELRQDPKTIIGASLVVQAPTGEYDSDRLINIGTNRWSLKPALGIIVPLAPTWLFEMEVGAWLFGDNDDFLGETRKQDPIASVEMHLVKRIRPGFWASLDANYYAGGKTRVGDELRADLQRNSRAGFTVVIPMKGRHALRGSFSTGVVTESGGDFDIVSLSYLYGW